jgi:hypothetical protein
LFRVFGGFGVGDDPAHLRQLVGLHVGAQLRQIARAHGPGTQLGRGAGQRGVGIAENLETDQRVVVVVVGHVLVDLPTDAGCLQAFRVGSPAVAAQLGFRLERIEVVVGGGSAAQAVRVVAAGPLEQAVGVGAAEERAVVGVTDGKGVGQRVMKRQVSARVVAQAVRPLGLRPLAHAALVPGLLGIQPAVRCAFGAHQGKVALRVQVKRQ